MNMPGFTAERSIFETGGRYCMATAFDSPNASASVQPAYTSLEDCLTIEGYVDNAIDRGDAGWAMFWLGAWKGAGCNLKWA
jgi:hypothetical protein